MSDKKGVKINTFSAAMAEMRGAVAVGNFLQNLGGAATYPIVPQRAMSPLPGTMWRLAAMAEERRVFELQLHEIVELAPLDRLHLTEKLFDECDAIRREFSERLRNAERTFEAYSEVREWFAHHSPREDEIFQALNLGAGESIQMALLTFRSSYKQVLTRGTMDHVLDCLRTVSGGPEHLKERAASSVSRFSEILCTDPPRVERIFGDAQGYWTTGARKELSHSFFDALSSEATHRKWDKTALVLTLPLNGIDLRKGCPLFQHLPWPLSPNDPILQSILRVLGWKLQIVVVGNDVVVSIDFGEHFLEQKGT